MNIVIVSKNGNDKQTHKFSLKENEPLTIGRAWQNDIVLDDDFIDPEHARITLENSVVSISDTDTRNGTFVTGKAVKSETAVKFGAKIEVGDASLQIYHATAQAKPALKRDWISRLTSALSSPAWLVSLTVLMLIGLSIDTFFMNGGEQSDKASSFMWSIGFLIVWCIGAGFIGKIFRQKMQLLSHWVLACLTLLLFLVLNRTVDVLDFNFHANWMADIAEPAAIYGTLLLFVYGSLSLVSRLGMVAKMGVASLFVLLPLSAGYFSTSLQTHQQKWSDDIVLENYNQPPALAFGKARPVDQHLDSIDDLFARADKEVNLLARKQGIDTRVPDVPVLSELTGD